jgi:MFS family permease
MLASVRGVSRRIADSARAFGEVVGNPNLRRLEVAWAWSIFGHWAYLVAVSVYAYNAGGETAVGLILALRLIPAALLSPFAGLLADRYRRELVLLVSTLTRMAFVAAAAAGVFLDVEPPIVYALAIAAAIAQTPVRSTQAALTPSLAQTPGELTAANAVATTAENLAVFLGPALAGLLLAITSTGVVFVVNAAMLAVAAFFIVRIRVPRSEREREVEPVTILSEALAGFRVIGRDPALRVLVGLFTAQTLVAGALEVFIVVTAFETLGAGQAGVGYLNSAIGLGALLGGLFALSLTGVRRLSPPFALGVLGWGAPLILLGVWPMTAPAIVFLGILGACDSIGAVAGYTLVQRAVPDDVLARVFGVIQMLWYLSLGVGALIAPPLVGWLGIDTALIATGASVIALVALLWTRLQRIDATAAPPEPDELRILASVPIFAPLPGASLEHLAARLAPHRVESGTTIVRQGEEADRFYLLAEGEVEVSADGKPISKLEAGDYFGEIALLRDIPRTATVTARTPVVLYTLGRDDFLAAVTGHPPSAHAAETVVSARLANLTPASTRLPASQ